MTASAGGASKNLALQLNAALLALSINATSVAFGDIVINTPATQPVTLTSTGTVPVTIGGVTLSGTGFTVSGPQFPAVLNPSQETTLNVEFDPDAPGAATGQLAIASNSSTNSAAVIHLSGTGTPAPAVSVAVTPASASVVLGASQQFAASVTGTSNTAVTWTLSGKGCSGTACGTVSSGGLYTAPATVPSTATVTITATSVSDPSKSGSAVVGITLAQPFLSTSPWNTPVANLPGVLYFSIGSAISHSVRNPTISPWAGAGWVAIYSAQATDSLVQIYYNPNAWKNISDGVWLNSGNSRVVEATIMAGSSNVWPKPWNNYSTSDLTGLALIPPASYHSQQSYYWTSTPNIPALAVPAPGADGHMAVFQPNGWVLETLATIRLSNGNIVCGYAGYTWPKSSGTGFQNGRRASMIPNYAGVIRNGELSSGVIRHALALDLPQDSLTRAISWPAYAVDMNNNYSGSIIPFGGLLVIPADKTNADLGIRTPLGAAIANALRTYGAYVVDSTDSGSSIFDTEVEATDLPAWSGPAEADLQSIMDALELATFIPGTDSVPMSHNSNVMLGSAPPSR
ncbi:MAG: choice-of-anchor D domain-containing protein [Terriglobales bacterium]